MIDSRYPIAATAALLAEPARVALLSELLDGRALPAGELARAARLSTSLASMHLAKLSAGRLVSVTAEGRHRYYRLAGPAVAHALEALGGLCGLLRPTQRPAGAPLSALHAARTCYDHLAGRLAVDLCAGLLARGYLREEGNQAGGEDPGMVGRRVWTLTAAGAHWFERRLGVGVAGLLAGAPRRALVRGCLDWTERREHLAGRLGAALLSRSLQAGWLERVPGGGRAVTLTGAGQAVLGELLPGGPVEEPAR